MTVYVDSSALLRFVLGEPGALALLHDAELVSSELLAVECLRTIDRLAVQGRLSFDHAAQRRGLALDRLESVDLVLLRRPILARACEPFTAPLGTLDALHLATLLAWRESHGAPLVLATHDRDLAVAARAYGIEVHGV